jgi:hypothetical protein
MTNKTKRTIIIINTIIICAMLGGGAILKIAGIEKIRNDFTKIGVGEYIQTLGVLELVLLALLLFPKTMRIGFFLLCGYFGGAIATHLSHHDMFLQPAVPLFFVCLHVFLRDKYLFKPSSGQFITY